jgi:VIT1/CCC1 family predicted Fe2+/Mn2+ transporter
MSILGVVFYASGHAGLVFPVAVSGGLTAAVSMAAGQLLSDGGDPDPASAAAMGAATLAGSILPAVPYALWHGALAPIASVAVCMAIAAVVGRLRQHRRHRYAETFAVLAVVVAVAIACALVFPGGGGAG